MVPAQALDIRLACNLLKSVARRDETNAGGCNSNRPARRYAIKTNKNRLESGEILMGNPNKTNRNTEYSNHLKISAVGLHGRKSDVGCQSLLRIMLVFWLAAGFCLAAGQNAVAVPTQLGSTVAVNGITLHGNTLSNFTISSGSDRILIVTVDDEEPTHVTSVMMGSVAMTYVGGQIAEPGGTGNTTSMWVILDEDLPPDGAYDIVVTGGDKPSVAAMLWSGLRQDVPAGSAIAGTGQVGGNQITTSVVAPEADSLVVGTSGHGANDGWATAPSGWTRQWDVEPNSAHHAGATRIPAVAGSISLTETCGGTGDFNRAAQFVAAFAPALSGPPGCPTCGFHRAITIPPASLSDNCGADVANFPVLISIANDNNLKLATNKVQSSSGYDIAFTDSSGNALYHDLELYDGTLGTVVAWVKVPTLASSADTVIYMVYGDSSVSTPTAVPQGVWASGYRGVWHMKESPGGSNDIQDSTSNANHGTSHNMFGNRTSGKIGYGLDFDGTSDYIVVPDAASLDAPAELTLEAWVKLANAGNDQKIVGKTDLPQYGPLLGALGGLRPEFWNSSHTNYSFNSGTISSNQWAHLAVTWKTNGNMIGYINGNQVNSISAGSNNLGTNDSSLIIGAAPWAPDTLEVDGVLDEIRISSAVRDACWIGTEYNNQNNPGTFYNLGTEEQLGDHTITATADENGLISPNGQVSVVDGADQTFTVTPDPGYQVSEVLTEDGAVTLTNGQYTFSNVSDDHTIYVTFNMVEGEFDWSQGSFDYRKQVSISADMLPDSSCPSSLANYPVLIKIENDSDLKAHVQNSAGYDIVFKLGDGTPLNYEVEDYDAATGSLVAWVRIPTLSNTTDTNIYMYYGNTSVSSAQGGSTWVWDFANYEGVWHLNESPGDNVAAGHKDSTSNANHGTAMDFHDGGGGSTAVAGLTAGADRFVDDQNDRVVVADDDTLTLASDFTLETWVKFDSISTDQHLLYKQHSSSPYFSYFLYVMGDHQPALLWNNNSSQQTTLTLSTAVDTGHWYYLVAVKDAGSLRIYLRGNGAQGSNSTSVTGATYDANTTLNIGGQWSGGTGLDGLMDEVRISSVPRTVCWIDTSYNNMSSPHTYITVGGEEGQGDTYTITSSAGSGGSITPLGTVTVAEGADKTYTVSAASGYQVDEVLTDEGAVTLTNGQYTFANVTGPHTITVTFVSVAGDYGWDGAGSFLFRRPLVIDHTKLGGSCGADVSNFPVLVHTGGDDNLKSPSPGHVANQSGYDIIFKDADGVLLAHEIESYNNLTGALTAWVRVPGISRSADTTIYMYYGNSLIDSPTENPSGVWDANYKGVWHFDENALNGTTGEVKDSTSNAKNGTSHSMTAANLITTGPIGPGYNFILGGHDYLDVPDDDGDLAPANLTVETWIQINAGWGYNDKILKKKVNWNDTTGWFFELKNQSQDPDINFMGSGGTNSNLKVGWTQGSWHHLVFTVVDNGTNATVTPWLDGTKLSSEAAAIDDIEPNSGVRLEIAYDEGGYVPVALDDLKISDTVRSDCWIETEYSNQNDPSAFISLGGEEAQGATYTITASAGANGSISPAGAVTVAEGGSKTFSLVADDGYQVDTLAIGGAAAQSYAGAQYLFTNVTANTSIAVTFKAVVAEPPPEPDVPPGCSKNVAYDYSGGFDTENLTVVNADVDDDGYVTLNTGNQAIDPENIVIPFRQEVAVYFFYEGAGYNESDFGWMLASGGSDGTNHEVYQEINDNNDNGVLDISKSSTANRYGDVNGDGVVNALDNRQVLGTFDAGTELVFYLKVNNENKTYYSKTAWNPDTYAGLCDFADWSTKKYWLGLENNSEGVCNVESNWMTASAIARAGTLFGLAFAADDTSSLQIKNGEKFSHVIVGAPASRPNAWVLGWEDYYRGLDTDHNDMVFIIERETGGTVQLKPEAAIKPSGDDDNINGVTIGVWDFMPCPGETDITYYLSIDAGAHWVEVTGWDEVYEYTMVGDGRKFLGDAVTNWTPGIPNYTYRTRRVDFAGLGLSGKELIWRADLKSQQEGCEPKVIDMSLDLTIGVAGHISRSTPTVLANVMYSGNMETPAADWSWGELRGHLLNTRIYDPTDPSQTSTKELWDAGDVLKNQMQPGDRKIYIPDVTVQAVDAGSAEQLATGDGVTTAFSGRLAHYPLLATTVRLSDQHETFSDKHTDVLTGSLGGSGWINRFTGEYRITFNDAPTAGQPVTATYSYFTYNTGGTLREFKEGLVSAAELGLDNETVVPSGYVYDFNNDDAFSAADANWLVDWTRGYRDGSSKAVEKEWILGAIDHSVAAAATPPASSPWYYGTAFPEDALNTANDRKGYRAFRDAQINRRTVVYVGARDGMLHAFDAGVFSWIDTNNDTAVDEARGLFAWDDLSGTGVTYCDDITHCPDYGTGKELWAFIPANLLPRLKNNYLQGDDQAYVDASPALADVYVNGAWRTVLLSAEGNGGDTIFCLDVTDPYTPKFMWEFADPDLFRSRSSPSVAQIGRIYYNGTTKWVAFFVSGKTYDDTLYPSIYLIDIADGSVVERVFLDAEPAGAGGILSGQPTIVDSDGNGYVDRLYIGSDKGRLYKVNLPDDPDTVKYGINHCVVNTDFTDRDVNEVPTAWHYQPIYGSPSVVAGNSVDLYGHMTYDIRIFFGTGDSPYYDEDVNFADTRYFFYAYRDTTAKGTCDSSQVALDWFFQLPEGHRIYASAFAAAGNIYFGTSTGETEDPCDTTANANSSFDPNAGKLFVFNMDNPNDLPLFEKTVGNILAAPLVEDKHIYVQSVGGDIDSFGSGQYNSRTRQGGIPKIEIHWWREMF